MKVVRVANDIPKCNCGWELHENGVEIGDILTVLRTHTFECGCQAYEFIEKGSRYGYWIGNYAPISDIDGDQLYEEEKENLKINLEVPA